MDSISNGNISLSLSDIQFALWKGKKKILIISVAGFFVGVIMMLINAFIIKNNPQYTMSAAIAVNSQNESGTFASNSINPNYQDVYLAQNLADSVIYVATSGKVLNTVIDKLQLVNITASSLKKSLKLEQYEESQIIQISFVWKNPQEGLAILSEITNVLPDYLIDTLKIGSVTIVDEPTTAVEVRNSYDLFTAIMLGGICFVLTICIYIVGLIIRPTFLTGKDVERNLDLEVIGEIPRDEHLSEIGKGEMITHGSLELSMPFQESFVSAANILCHLLKQKEQKIILVTSTHSGEGKTTTTVNLAYHMSCLTHKVLMIDCDFRKPSLGGLVLKTFDKKRTLNAVYHKEIAAPEALIELKENLYILPCFLEKRRMVIDQEMLEIIKALAIDFDYVLLDTSPIGLVSDVMRLNEIVDSTLYIIRQNKVWQELVADSIERLTKSGFLLSGCIVNDISINTPGNKYYYKNYEKEYSVYKGRKNQVLKIENKIDIGKRGPLKIPSQVAYENKVIYEDKQVYENKVIHEDNQACENKVTHEDNQAYENKVTHEDNQAYENKVIYEDKRTYENKKAHKDKKTYESKVTYENKEVYEDKVIHENRVAYENKTTKFAGKTLLILGSNVGAVDIVNYAKENGAYTIVVDNLPVESSEAKQKADKHMWISTSETNQLVEVVKNYHVDGVLTGISEFNILQAMKLAEATGVSFYCTRAQRESVESKECFRKMCMEYNVSAPKTFFVGSKMPSKEEINGYQYPVVIKPVDGTTSEGVCFCEDAKELEENWLIAKRCSAKGKVIVEQKVRGAEFTTIYLIVEGKAKLVSIDNRYPVAVNKGNVTTIPIARVYPSLFIDEYTQQMNTNVINLCENIGVKNGIVMMQGIYNKEENKFYMFEAGLRCSAEATYRFIREMTGHSFIQVLVEEVLLGKSNYPIETEDPYHGGKVCAIVSLVGKGGIVRSIRGLEEALDKISSIVTHESRYPVGSVVPTGNTLRQLMIRFVMVCDSREQLASDIRTLNELVSVLNHNGEEMVIKFNPQMVYEID